MHSPFSFCLLCIPGGEVKKLATSDQQQIQKKPPRKAKSTSHRKRTRERGANRIENLFENTNPTLAMCQWKSVWQRQPADSPVAMLARSSMEMGLHPCLQHGHWLRQCRVRTTGPPLSPSFLFSGAQQRAKLPPPPSIYKVVWGGANRILNAFSLRLVTNQWCLLSPLLCNLTLEVLSSTVRQQKEIKSI